MVLLCELDGAGVNEVAGGSAGVSEVGVVGVKTNLPHWVLRMLASHCSIVGA